MSSYIDWVRAFCLTLPHTTEDVQWEHNLLFRIAGKIYCIANLEPALSPSKISFKCAPEKFAELVEVEGIIPAPYMARNHWVTMVDIDVLRQPEIKELIRISYRLVMDKLPKKLQARLNGAGQGAASHTKRKSAAKRRK